MVPCHNDDGSAEGDIEEESPDKPAAKRQKGKGGKAAAAAAGLEVQAGCLPMRINNQLTCEALCFACYVLQP
jgi:hypothetical protein